MIATNQDQTNLTVICRRLAIKVTKTLDINVPGTPARDHRYLLPYARQRRGWRTWLFAKGLSTNDLTRLAVYG